MACSGTHPAAQQAESIVKPLRMAWSGRERETDWIITVQTFLVVRDGAAMLGRVVPATLRRQQRGSGPIIRVGVGARNQRVVAPTRALDEITGLDTTPRVVYYARLTPEAL